MKAAFVRSYETIEVVEAVSVPEPAESELLVSVKACSLSEIDVVAFRGGYSEILGSSPGPRPYVLGTAFSGVSGGEDVVGITALDKSGACAEFVVVPRSSVVNKPAGVSHETAAAAAHVGVAALSVLNGKLRASFGDVILVTDAASVVGVVIVQLASILWKAAVIAAVSTQDEVAALSGLKANKPVRIVNVSQENVIAAVEEETGGTGVLHIVDLASCTSHRGAQSQAAIRKRQLLQCLAVHGHWVTFEPELQLDPPNSRLLHLKDASVSMAFEASWCLAPTQQGRFLHMLGETLDMVAKGQLSVPTRPTFPLDKIRDAVAQVVVQKHLGAVVVVP